MNRKNSVIHRNMHDAVEFLAGDHTLLRELLHPDKEGLALPYSLAHARLEAGTASLPHRLQNSDELYFFLHGAGVLYLEKKPYPVKTGDAVLVPANCLQYLENTGVDQLTFLCIVSPPWSAGQEALE